MAFPLPNGAPQIGPGRLAAAAVGGFHQTRQSSAGLSAGSFGGRCFAGFG